MKLITYRPLTAEEIDSLFIAKINNEELNHSAVIELLLTAETPKEFIGEAAARKYDAAAIKAALASMIDNSSLRDRYGAMVNRIKAIRPIKKGRLI